MIEKLSINFGSGTVRINLLRKALSSIKRIPKEQPFINKFPNPIIGNH